MKDRYDELKEITESLRSSDFEKIAMGDGIKKEAQDPGMMGMPMGAAPPAPPMMDPSMLPPAGDMGAIGTEGAEAAKGMKEVALRALDLTQDAVAEALGSESFSPADKLDATAAALETSGALDGIPPEEIAAMAQTPPPPVI